MSANRRAWWVCNVCGRLVAPVGQGKVQGHIDAHRRFCPKSTCSIKNLPVQEPDKK